MQTNLCSSESFTPSDSKKSIPNKDEENRIFIRPPKILVIEDIEMLQRINMMSLKTIGCKPDLAKDGFVALRMFPDNYDLILSDIGLPGKNGIEIVKAIRLYEEKSLCKKNIIVALTAMESNLRECIEAGFDDFYIKPLLIDPMKEMIIRWLPHLINSPKKSKI